MVVLLVIDMQVGLFRTVSRYDADGTIRRINALSGAVRTSGGAVIFIQHDEDQGDLLEPGSQDWEIVSALEREANDLLVRKRACDAFYETDLQDILNEHNAKPLILTGCATDFCVDTTVRAAAGRDFEVIVAEDGHTTADRPHLDAVSIMQHHNWMWANLILPHSRVKVLPTQDILDRLQSGALT